MLLDKPRSIIAFLPLIQTDCMMHADCQWDGHVWQVKGRMTNIEDLLGSFADILTLTQEILCRKGYIANYRNAVPDLHLAAIYPYVCK